MRAWSTVTHREGPSSLPTKSRAAARSGRTVGAVKPSRSAAPGEALQGLVKRCAPAIEPAASGGILLLLGLLAIGAGAFLATRSAARAKARALDAGRRRFLAGAGSGAGAALAATVAAGATGAVR